jgi:non-specific serine/threonine protein kinase
VARCERDFERARPRYEESLALLRELGAVRDIPATLHNLAYVHLHQGDAERALSLFQESLNAQHALDNKAGVVEGLLGIAALLAVAGPASESVRLYGAAIGGSDAASLWPGEKIEYEHFIGLARTKMSDEAFQVEQARGRALSLGQAVEYALNLSLPLTEPAVEDKAAAQELTSREREIAVLIARGMSNGEIASELVLSKRTVEKHIANILSKLGFANRAQIVRWAIETKLI